MAHSLEGALSACSGAADIFVIGGAELYRESMTRAQRLELTEIHADFDGDAFFPEYAKEDWRESAREIHRDEAGIAFGYDFVRYERIG